MGIRPQRISTGYFDKHKQGLYTGELVQGPHGGLLRICHVGDADFVLLDSIMTPFDMSYAKECEKVL